MDAVWLTADQARRFLLLKQGLLGDYRFTGREGALAYVRQAGCIQFDPVDVCGRNAELTLQSRVKGFRKRMLWELLYADRLLVDYPDKELSIFPVEDWPYFEPFRKRGFEHGRQFEGLAELEEQAIGYIREHGPVSSDDLPVDGEIRWHSSMHWSGNWEGRSKAARSVLEQMYTEGRLAIHHKAGNRKVYDLAENCIPEPIIKKPDPCPDAQSHRKWRVLRRIGAVGMLPDRQSSALLGIRMTPEERNRTFEELAEEKKIIPVTVEGMKSRFYALAEDRKLTESASQPDASFRKRCEFLAPLDPFLWDRKLIESLFGFRYSWEIYTPAPQRKYGSYVLPILYGERFVGRLEAVADAKSRTLILKNLWFEEGTKQTKTVQNAIGASLKRFARFNGCSAGIRPETGHGIGAFGV